MRRSAAGVDRRVAAAPVGEARLHRLEALAGPLVGVGHDPLLARREGRPAAVVLPVEQRVTGWLATARASSGCPCRVSQAAEPSPWGSAARRIVRGQRPCRRRGAVPRPRPGAGRRRSRGRRSGPRGTRPPRPPRASAAATRSGDPGRAGGRRRPPAPGTVIGPMVADGRRRRPGARPAVAIGAGAGSRSGTSPVIGIAQRNATTARSAGAGVRVGRCDRRSDAAARPPDAATVHAGVRERDGHRPVEVGPEHTGARGGKPLERGRGRMAVRVPGARPTRSRSAGRTASTNGWVVAVRLPWCATLSRSSRGRPSASSDGSMSSSTSPASRNR